NAVLACPPIPLTSISIDSTTDRPAINPAVSAAAIIARMTLTRSKLSPVMTNTETTTTHSIPASPFYTSIYLYSLRFALVLHHDKVMKQKNQVFLQKNNSFFCKFWDWDCAYSSHRKKLLLRS